MLQTLRAYALTRLREAGEELPVMSALAGFAWSVAAGAAAELEGGASELEALRWLDAEDATLSRALGWALGHDPDAALRLATALAPWLRLRGRLAEARERLSAAVAGSSLADGTWARAQLCLGYLSSDSADPADGTDHYTAVIDAYRNLEPSRVLVQALASGRAIARLNLGDTSGAVRDARRGLELARELGEPAGELLALAGLSAAVYYSGDTPEALDWVRQAQAFLPRDIPGDVARWCRYVLALVLTEAGELACARRVCAPGVELARQVDDLANLVPLLEVMGDLERKAGNPADAGGYLEEAIDVASRIGHSLCLAGLIGDCGYLAADSGRWADAVTIWAALAADLRRRGRPAGPVGEGRRGEYVPRIEQALTPGQVREAEERGARMTVFASAELATIVAAAAATENQFQEAGPGTLLSPRERELVTLVAQGRTNAEIAARLSISIRTVASHLDRIRDKTGYRRRADLTRLALEESLV